MANLSQHLCAQPALTERALDGAPVKTEVLSVGRTADGRVRVNVRYKQDKPDDQVLVAPRVTEHDDTNEEKWLECTQPGPLQIRKSGNYSFIVDVSGSKIFGCLITGTGRIEVSHGYITSRK